MIPVERQEKILELLKERKSASVKKIAKYCNSSEATVRRDLIEMEKLMLLRRTRGGALFFESSNDETSVAVRMTENKDKKEKIAMLAMRILGDSKTLFFDSSSTVSVLGKAFSFSYRTIITTGLNCALILAEKENLNVIIPGGNVSYDSNTMVGSLTLKQLLEFNPDCAVFSCGGISGNLVTEATFEQSELKKLAFSKAKTRVLLCDSSKMGKKLPFSFTRLDDFDYLVTDCAPPEEISALVEKVKIIWK